MVDVTTPAPRDAWHTFADQSSDALAFQTPEWTDVVCHDGTWQDSSRLYTLSDGRQAVLPVLSVSRRLRRSADASMPYGWGFGGILTAGRVESAVVAAVARELATRPGRSLSVRPGATVDWEVARLHATPSPRRAHVLDLSGGFEHVWSERFRSQARTAVRKAERSGVEVELRRDPAAVDECYPLYERSIERWASASRLPTALARRRLRSQEPIGKLRSAALGLGRSCEYWIARVDGRPVAFIVVLRQGAQASYWRGAMDIELAGRVRANDLLHARAIEHACVEGCTAYNMGETGQSASLAQFKERFGAASVRYEEFHFRAG